MRVHTELRELAGCASLQAATESEMALSPKRLDGLAREVLDPLLVPLGFSFKQGVYTRRHNRLTSAIAVDFDVRSKRTFRVMLGLNSDLIFPENPDFQEGSIHHVFLRGEGTGPDPRNWPCSNEDEARASLSQVAGFVQRAALPWLDRYSTPGDLAEVLSPIDDYYKGVLFLADDRRAEAREWLERSLNRMRALPLTQESDQKFVHQVVRLLDSLNPR